MNVVWKKFCHTLAGFRTARGGNVAITFALATLPILGFVGAAVDYSRANSVKAAMQTALDSTALMLSKEAATDTHPGSVEYQCAEIFHRDLRETGSPGY
jgi:Flp pilus assembly protein TadG